MLPKITKNKFSSGYEKAQYFAELLDGYINLNKNTHEPTTEYNIMCINLINSAIDDKLNPMIIKLAIIGKISYESKDYGTNRNCYQIISSLQKQRNYYRMCRDTLEKAAINKNYYIIIKSNLNRGVVDRCNRLNESLLPNLIEDSKLNVYVDFLAWKGSTLEEDFKKYADCDFDSEEFHHYVALVSKRIDRHLKSVSEKKRAELLAGFERHKLLEQQRNEEKAISKVAKKEDTLREIKDNLSSKVTQIYDNAMLVQTAYMQTGSVAQKLYQRIDELISDKSVDAYLNDRVVVVALHPRNKSFSTSNIKYYVSGRKTLVTDMALASVLLERYDVQEIQGVVNKYQDRYVVDLGYIHKADEYIKGVGTRRLAELQRIEEEKNKKRIEKALSLGLSADATYEEIDKAEDDKQRIAKATSIGLSENATWKDINNFIKEQRRLEVDRLRREDKARIEEIQRQLPSLPVANSDIAVLAKLLSDYERSDDYFSDIVHLLHRVCYEYCDISYLSCIPVNYIQRYCLNLYDFTLSVFIYYRNLQGVVYKLCSKSAEFRSLNKEFNDCFSSIKKHRIYLHTPLESTNNLIAFYLECLSAIKLEGISMQQAFKDCPSIEKYYRECLHSDLKAFVKMIGYEAENTSNLYRAVKKIKENT